MAANHRWLEKNEKGVGDGDDQPTEKEKGGAAFDWMHIKMENDHFRILF